MPTLTVKHGREVLSDAAIEPGQSLTIGRDPGNDIVIHHNSVSSRHAKIDGLEEGYRLTDLGSTNGTFVGKQYVQTCLLKHADIITVGEATIRFAYADDEDRSARGVPGDDMDKTMLMDERTVYALTSHVKKPTEDLLESTVVSEMLEEMPSYMARGFIYLLVFVVFVGVIYSYFGKMDVVVQGRGKLIPQGEAAVVQSANTGLLGKLHVKEGSQVKKGQVLAELDVTRSNISAQKLRRQYEQKKKERACLEVAINVMGSVSAGEKVTIEREKMLQICENQYLDQIVGLQNARNQYESARFSAKLLQPDNLTSMTNMVKNKTLNLENKQLALTAAEEDLKRTRGKLDLYKEMFTQGLASKVKLMEEQKLYDEAVTRVNQSRMELDTAQGTLIQTRAKLSSTRLHYLQKNQQAEETWRIQKIKHAAALKNMHRRLEKVNTDIANSELDSQLQDFARKLDRIVAPVAGTVVSTALRTPGEMIKVGSTLFTINPSEQPLVAQAMIPNKSIGRIKVGLKTKLKLDAYPYQNYGVLTGRVHSIAPDSQKVGNSYFYEITVALDREYLEKSKQKYPLFTGLTLNAEIVVEARRIIENFLDPLRKLKD